MVGVGVDGSGRGTSTWGARPASESFLWIARYLTTRPTAGGAVGDAAHRRVRCLFRAAAGPRADERRGGHEPAPARLPARLRPRPARRRARMTLTDTQMLLRHRHITTRNRAQGVGRPSMVTAAAGHHGPRGGVSAVWAKPRSGCLELRRAAGGSVPKKSFRTPQSRPSVVSKYRSMTPEVTLPHNGKDDASAARKKNRLTHV